MKTQIRPFKFGDYVRFLKAKLSPRTRKEFSKSPLGYFIAAYKDFRSKIKVYKFSVYSSDKFVGFGAIYNERGFNEIRVFVLPKYRGKGIATEATRQLTEYCFKRLGFKSIRTVIEEKKSGLEDIMKKLKFKLVKKDSKNKLNIWEKKNEN